MPLSERRPGSTHLRHHQQEAQLQSHSTPPNHSTRITHALAAAGKRTSRSIKTHSRAKTPQARSSVHSGGGGSFIAFVVLLGCSACVSTSSTSTQRFEIPSETIKKKKIWGRQFWHDLVVLLGPPVFQCLPSRNV